MSRTLNQYGIRVTGKSSVGDTREAILDGIQQAARFADIVIMTGGLGPTKDDITKKTLAELFESDMYFDETVYKRIEAYFVKVEKKISPAMRDQATLPRKATILTNKVGTAPGMWFESNDKVYISLPGVPFEMEYLMREEVVPRLLKRFQSRPIAHRTLLTAGEGESNLARRIESFEDNLPSNIKLAYLPALGEVRLRLSGVWEGEVTPDAAAQLDAQLDAKAAALEALIPEFVYGYGEGSLAAAVGEIAQKHQWQITTAESCTGGYIAHLLTSIPGASEWFPGSIVAYSYESKENLLKVRRETLETEGAVSEACVREMAIGALDTMNADVAISVSGIAGPGGGTPEKPVGTVWIAVADQDRVVTARHVFGRDRLKNIQLTGVYALTLLRKFLVEKGA